MTAITHNPNNEGGNLGGCDVGAWPAQCLRSRRQLVSAGSPSPQIEPRGQPPKQKLKYDTPRRPSSADGFCGAGISSRIG